MTQAQPRLPVVYLPHGGGPWPFVEMGLGSQNERDALRVYLESVRELPPSPPRALLVISAHWEEPQPTVMSATRPPLLFDYYGFPPESYALTWPAPGSPELAERVRQLLGAAGIEARANAERGFDHGTFVPLKLTYPEAQIPTLQLSLKAGLDPSEHLAIGRALRPLRDEGVFIIGSGMSYHNMRGFGPQGRAASAAFDGWLRAAVTADRAGREEQLRNWAQAPSARAAHPREEHLLPLMVVAGAAGDDAGRVAFHGTFLSTEISAHVFG